MLSKKLLLTLVTICLPAVASDALKIKKSSLLSATKLGTARLYHDKQGFHVMDNGKRHDVEKHNVDRQLRDMSPENMKKYLAVAKLNVTKTGDDYIIRSHIDGKGGGPVAGLIAYWVTKSICWGGVSAAAGAAIGGAVVATGGTVGAPLIAGAGTLITGAGAMGTAGATVAAGVIGTSATTTALAGSLVGATASGVGGVGATIAAIETASSTAMYVFTLIPFLP